MNTFFDAFIIKVCNNSEIFFKKKKKKKCPLHQYSPEIESSGTFLCRVSMFFPMLAWLPSGYSSFLVQSKHMLVSLIGDSGLSVLGLRQTASLSRVFHTVHPMTTGILSVVRLYVCHWTRVLLIIQCPTPLDESLDRTCRNVIESIYRGTLLKYMFKCFYIC